MSQPYWDPQLETLAPERRRRLREHRLHWQLRRCWDGSPFYRARLEAAGLDPSSFSGTDDWARLPVLRDSDLPAIADWAVAPEAWWDHRDAIPGHPERAVTDGDAIQQADLAARALWAAGARPDRAWPVSLDNADELTRRVRTAGADRIGAHLTGGSASVVPAVGVSFVSPTLAYRCHEGDAIHWNDDHFLIELTQPETGHPARQDRTGAVLVTDLAREGSPLLRFRTGLEADLIEEPCSCGRTSARASLLRPLA
jgi:hypothetical protein